MIDRRANVNAEGWMGATPLHDAAQHGRADVATLLVGRGADVDARRRDRRDTPLHWAATEAVARLLVGHGADIEARDWVGRMPLHWAAQFGHDATARYLIGVGATVDARADRPPTANRLLSAIAKRVTAVFKSDQREIVGGRKDPGYTGVTPLHWAAQEGKAEVATALLEHGADANARAHDGRTPLHKAAFRGHHAVVELLVRVGADPNVRDNDGQTPIHAAQRQETRDLLRRLAGPAGPADVPLTTTPADLRLPLDRVCVHPDGREAVAVAHNAVLSRWLLERPPRMLTGLLTSHPWVTDLTVLPDGQSFLAVSPAGVEVRRWDDLRLVGTFDPQGGSWSRPTAVAASPDGRWVAVADGPEELLLLDRVTGQVTDRVESGERTMAVRFSPDSRLLATACSFQGGGSVRLDAVGDDGRLTRLAQLERSDRDTPPGRFVDTLARLAFGPDGRHLALFETSAVGHRNRPAGWRGDVVLFEVEGPRWLWSASIDAGVTGDKRSIADAGHPMGFVTDVVFADPGLIACGATRGAVLFYSAATGSLVAKSVVHDDAAVKALAHDLASGLVWAGLEDGGLVPIEVPSGGEG